MRWFWIDRFTEFESGRRAKAVKAVSLVEEYIDEYFTGAPMMSPSFVIEGFAQMGGLLVGEQTDFKANVVLAKVSKSVFNFYARPGDRLDYEVTIESLTNEGGIISATSHVDDRLQGEAQLTFVQISRDQYDFDFFEPAEFLRMLRIYKLFKVGTKSDGSPIPIPQHLLDAEQAQVGGIAS